MPALDDMTDEELLAMRDRLWGDVRWDAEARRELNAVEAELAARRARPSKEEDEGW